MEDLDESWLMEDHWDDSWLMEDEEEEEDETLRKAPSQLVMCSICSGFVMARKKRTSMEAAEVVTEAKKMRALTNAVLLHGPLQETEPAQATKKQRRFLGQMRTIMMETKTCPACSRSVLGIFPTCSACCCCCLSKKPRHDEEEDKPAGSKEKKKKKNSREEGSELMAGVLPSQCGKERKKSVTTEEDEAMVKKSKQSREDCNGSSSGLKKKKARSSSKVKSYDKEGCGSKKKAKGGSSEMEGSGREEAEMEGNRSKDVKMKVRESASGNGKTKMVTRRMDKMSIDFLLEKCPPFKPHTYDTLDPFLECMFASNIAKYNVDLEFRDYLRRQASIRGYAEYQLEVTDDEEE